MLKVKKLGRGEPKSILGLALDPPSLDDIEWTILTLKEVCADTSSLGVSPFLTSFPIHWIC